MKVYLEVSHEKANVRHVVLSRQAIIGRGTECDMRIASRLISRKHCQLGPVDNKVLVRDLGSANGTYVDGNRLKPLADYSLQDGAEILIGPLRLLVRFKSAPAEPTSSSVAEPDVGRTTTTSLASSTIVDNAEPAAIADPIPELPEVPAEPEVVEELTERETERASLADTSLASAFADEESSDTFDDEPSMDDFPLESDTGTNSRLMEALRDQFDELSDSEEYEVGSGEPDSADAADDNAVPAITDAEIVEDEFEVAVDSDGVTEADDEDVDWSDFSAAIAVEDEVDSHEPESAQSADGNAAPAVADGEDECDFFEYGESVPEDGSLADMAVDEEDEGQQSESEPVEVEPGSSTVIDDADDDFVVIGEEGRDVSVSDTKTGIPAMAVDDPDDPNFLGPAPDLDAPAAADVIDVEAVAAVDDGDEDGVVEAEFDGLDPEQMALGKAVPADDDIIEADMLGVDVPDIDDVEAVAEFGNDAKDEVSVSCPLDKKRGLMSLFGLLGGRSRSKPVTAKHDGQAGGNDVTDIVTVDITDVADLDFVDPDERAVTDAPDEDGDDFLGELSEK